MACCEAEVDCLSGNFVIRRTDIVMDVGHSLAPNLDIGQIEGAVVQVQLALLQLNTACAQLRLLLLVFEGDLLAAANLLMLRVSHLCTCLTTALQQAC